MPASVRVCKSKYSLILTSLPSFISGRTVIDGPFTEAKELVAGYWIWDCASRDEAIEWLKRAPFDGGVEIELRQIFEVEDFAANLTPELRAANERLREQSAAPN